MADAAVVKSRGFPGTAFRRFPRVRFMVGPIAGLSHPAYLGGSKTRAGKLQQNKMMIWNQMTVAAGAMLAAAFLLRHLAAAQPVCRPVKIQRRRRGSRHY